MKLDKTFGINKQAQAVLAYLDEFDFLEDYGWHKIVPWYNGRESGYCISLKHKTDQKWLNICFYEHRNSDNICCLKWETKNTYLNHPVEDPEIWDKAYGTDGDKYSVAKSFYYGQAGDCANWVYARFEEFYTAIATDKGE